MLICRSIPTLRTLLTAAACLSVWGLLMFIGLMSLLMSSTPSSAWLVAPGMATAVLVLLIIQRLAIDEDDHREAVRLVALAVEAEPINRHAETNDLFA